MGYVEHREGRWCVMTDGGDVVECFMDRSHANERLQRYENTGKASGGACYSSRVEHKSFGVAELKATGPASSGSFEAIVSAFGNVDEGGDRMLKGAFEDTLKAPPEGRGFPPIVWSHLWGVVPIGGAQKAEEVEGYKTAKGDLVDGLYIAGDLFVDEHQTAKEVYVAMSRKGGDGLPVLRDFSFGYAATQAATKKAAPDGYKFEAVSDGHIRDLITVDLYEVGPTLVGMNDQASLIDAKSLQSLSLEHVLAQLKAGARNSSKDSEMLQQIHDLTTELGIDCGGKSARTTRPNTFAAALTKQIAGRKGYDDIDSYAIYLLTNMIDAGSSFIIGEEDPADVQRMRALLLEVAQMLADEIGEQEPDSGEQSEQNDVIEMVGAMLDDLPMSGTKRHPAGAKAASRTAVNELLLATRHDRAA